MDTLEEFKLPEAESKVEVVILDSGFSMVACNKSPNQKAITIKSSILPVKMF